MYALTDAPSMSIRGWRCEPMLKALLALHGTPDLDDGFITDASVAAPYLFQ
jgi:hypothetical protein